MSDAPFDLPRAHRWLAVELNNTAWDLLDKPDRTRDETERMIHAAHASVHHWLAAGNALNHLRGMVLLANVYAGAKLGEMGVRYAERALQLSEQCGETSTIFDRATAHACAARAYHVSGNEEGSLRQVKLAREIAAGLELEEQAVFEQLCPAERA